MHLNLRTIWLVTGNHGREIAADPRPLPLPPENESNLSWKTKMTDKHDSKLTHRARETPSGGLQRRAHSSTGQGCSFVPISLRLREGNATSCKNVGRQSFLGISFVDSYHAIIAISRARVIVKLKAHGGCQAIRFYKYHVAPVLNFVRRRANSIGTFQHRPL